MSAIRIEQNIFQSIVQMANEMNKAEQMKQANTRLFNQVKQAFKDAHEWNEVLTYDDEECEQHNIDLDAEHPLVKCFTVRIRHWVEQALIEVDTGIHMNTDYDDHFYDESSYYYDTFGSGMEDIETALVKQLTTLIDSADASMTAVAKVAPIIRQEIDRLLTYVNRLAYCPQRPPVVNEDGSQMVGSIRYRKNVIRKGMFDSFLDENPTITHEQINLVASEKQYEDAFIFA